MLNPYPLAAATHMNNRFPEKVVQILRANGWNEGITHDAHSRLASNLPLFPAADSVLREFNGFRHDPDDAAGIEFAKASFYIAPLNYEGIEESYREEEQALGKRLYPIGGHLDEPIHLLIADDGTPYSWSEFGIYQDGETFDDALTYLILGKRPASGFTLYPVFDRDAKPGEKGTPRFEWLLSKT